MTKRSTGAWSSQQAGRAAGAPTPAVTGAGFSAPSASFSRMVVLFHAGRRGRAGRGVYRDRLPALPLGRRPRRCLRCRVLDDVEDRASRLEAGEGQLAGLSRLWVGAVLDWGHALVYLRSRRGFLERRSQQDPRAQRLVEVAEPRLRAECLALTGRITVGQTSSATCSPCGMSSPIPRRSSTSVDRSGWPPARIAENLHRSLSAVVLRQRCATLSGG